MPKKPLSITLEIDNLIWLRGRAASRKRRSLSEAIDEILTGVRTGAQGAIASRSVAGTVDIAADDPGLDRADAYVRGEIEASLARPLTVRESRSTYATRTSKRARGRKTGRRTRG